LIRTILASLLLCAAASAANAPVPRPSPEFVVHLAAGGQVTPAQYKGKVVLLALIATTCPHCQRATQVMSGLQKEYGPRGLQVLGAAFNDMSNMLVPDFIKQFQPAFPVGYATRMDVLTYLQHSQMEQLYVPIFVFIDRKGIVRHQFLGDDPFHQNQEKNMRATIEEMLKEPAGPATTKKAAPVTTKKAAVAPSGN
jgi:thiol-disulfide isomerase/thioredoxin